MVCAFVRAEIDSPDAAKFIVPTVLAAGYTVTDFRAALARPNDLRDAQVVQTARSALAFRGFGRNDALFRGFPSDVEWWRALLDDNDFAKMRYGCEPSWVAFAPSRLVRDGAVAVSTGSTNGHAVKVAQIALDMAAGKQYDEIILVHTGDGNLILLEGWHRATAYAMCGMTDVSAFVGVSKRLDSWHWF